MMTSFPYWEPLHPNRSISGIVVPKQHFGPVQIPLPRATFAPLPDDIKNQSSSSSAIHTRHHRDCSSESISTQPRNNITRAYQRIRSSSFNPSVHGIDKRKTAAGSRANLTPVSTSDIDNFLARLVDHVRPLPRSIAINLPTRKPKQDLLLIGSSVLKQRLRQRSRRHCHQQLSVSVEESLNRQGEQGRSRTADHGFRQHNLYVNNKVRQDIWLRGELGSRNSTSLVAAGSCGHSTTNSNSSSSIH